MQSTQQLSNKTGKPRARDIREFRKNEIEYWRALYREIPGSDLVPVFSKKGPFCAFKMPGIDILAFNRVLVLPDDLKNDPASYLDEVVRFYRSSAIPRFFLQLPGPTDTPDFRTMLYEIGFRHYNDWTRVSRPANIPVDISGSHLKIERIGEKRAATYAETIVRSFDFPESLIPHFSSTVGSRGFSQYLVFENDVVIAAGALFIRKGYASMAIAGTLPDHRGKGAQQKLLSTRILHALDAGCRWITAETSRESPEKKVVSFRNMVRSGFSIACHRPNFIFYP